MRAGSRAPGGGVVPRRGPAHPHRHRAARVGSSLVGVLVPSRVRTDRGALAVEAALLIPFVLIPLVFGIIETALLLKDKVTVTSMARNAARVASSSDPNYPNLTVPSFVTAVAQTVASSVPELPAGAMQEVWIYLPVTGKNYPSSGTDANPFPNLAAGASCGTNCIRLVWTQRTPASTSTFNAAIGTWPSNTIKTCLPNMDNVGVYVRTQHRFFTGLFGGTLRVSDAAVMRFEPQDPVADPDVTGDVGCVS